MALIMRSVCIDEMTKPVHKMEVAANDEDSPDANRAATYIDVADIVDVKIFVEDLLAVLNDDERRILLEVEVEEKTLMEVGKEEGCSHTTIASICRRAKEKMREFSARRRPV